MLRREFIAGLIALASTPRAGFAEQGEPGLKTSEPLPFSAEDVIERAKALAERAYDAPTHVPEAWTALSYDQYNSIWFDGRNALWADEDATPLKLDVFAPGLYFPAPIEINIVEDGKAGELLFDMGVFDKTDKFPNLPIDDTLGYSGLRLRAELETPGIFQEFAVFQGASYFRAISTGSIYGLSARGLAIDTGAPSGEEFPEFRAFWIEKPAPGSDSFTVHALLDGPSCTGAYKFEITHGAPLVMDVDAHIFPRSDCETIGIAPLTSMFWYDQTNRHRSSDFRPAVHDSDGMLIENGAGETLWRPLANPKNVQFSSFVDENPRGFGLMQRARRFGDFADLEALYHRRPGVWIEPKGNWGAGYVTLVEIPTDKEIYDNIVSYWQPAGGLKEGSENHFAYRLTWSEDSDYGTGLRVLNTAMGAGFDDNGIIVAIDFAPDASMPASPDDIDTLVRASAGEVTQGVLQRNPETGGPRLTFKFHPGEAELIEFRAQLLVGEVPLSEVWLYRWTA